MKTPNGKGQGDNRGPYIVLFLVHDVWVLRHHAFNYGHMNQFNARFP